MPVNFYDEYDVAGQEISSTYEGRHITLPESLLIHPSHTDGFVDKGDPVVSGDIVGVALLDGDADTDQISIDTEGIWALSVVATDADGDSAVAVGDEIFINTTTAVLSKNNDKNTQQRFGYALMSADAGETDVIAIKVHWNPDDAEEMVGSSAVPYVLGAELIGQEFRYSTLLTTARAMYVELDVLGAGLSNDCLRPRIMIGEVAAATAQGLHAGLEFSGDTLGRITGLGVGGRLTYFANNRGQTGTICGGMSELFAKGTSTDYATAIHSIHRFVNDGNATGLATAVNVFEFAGLSANQFVAATNAVIDHALRIIVNGVTYYIGLYDATA